MAMNLPAGLIEMDERGIMSEIADLDESSNLYKLADTVIRATGALVGSAARAPECTVENGPLGESYSPDELTGLQLKDSEEELLATFIEGAEGDLGSLSVISIVRPDKFDPYDNRVWAPALGLGRNDYYIPMNGLGKYLGIE